MAVQIAKTNTYVSMAPRPGVVLVAKANNYVAEGTAPEPEAVRNIRIGSQTVVGIMAGAETVSRVYIGGNLVFGDN